MPTRQRDLFDFRSPELPEGFRYQGDVITAGEEEALLEQIVPLPFKEFQFHGFEGKRRVVSFGWRYDYSERQLSRAEPMPLFLLDLFQLVQSRTGFGIGEPGQALVTEYTPGAAIGWHRDKPEYGQVLGLSLASACVLRLRKAIGSKWERVSVQAAPRSAYLFDGPVRWEWEHSIPAVENLRYSVTFRTLRTA